jgi:uncharacterized SAM-binding protein YcdF (DUF218 family)
VTHFRPIDEEFQRGILVDNVSHREDQEVVLSFIRLMGRPNRPIDPVIYPREPTAFAQIRSMLPEDFFDPFDQLLRAVGMPELQVEPDLAAINEWNTPFFASALVASVERALDEGGLPRLVPLLVDVFRNLEREHQPSDSEWQTISAITIPGSRTYDRAAEAYRAYRKTQGNAYLITSGRAPYYDPRNADTELTEAEANAAYLRMLGVPASRIITEGDSKDTNENAAFLPRALRRIPETKPADRTRLLLVTSPFHLARYRLGVEALLESQGTACDVFALASRAGYYWAETYFLTDAKSAYNRQGTMGIVFNEYLKIAFDICAKSRPREVKEQSIRLG